MPAKNHRFLQSATTVLATDELPTIVSAQDNSILCIAFQFIGNKVKLYI